MPDLHRQLGQARETFGHFLRNWRKANGWVITTPQDWAKACPELIPPGLRVSSGQWANLENAQIKQAQPSTFLQLAALNQALSSSRRGRISDPLLRERVQAAKPVLHDDGSAWGPQDWFACYIGNLEGPADLWPKPGANTGELSAEQLRRRYLELVEAHELLPVTALLQLLGSRKLRLEQQMDIEAGLLHAQPMQQGTLQVLEQALNSWQSRLEEAGSSGQR